MARFLDITLREVSGKVLREEDTSSSLRVDVDPDIAFGFNNDDTEPPYMVGVRIRLTAKVVPTESDESEPFASAFLEYVGRFEFEDVSNAEFKASVLDSSQQDLMVSQIYPVAIVRLKTVLEELGYTATDVPLSVRRKGQKRLK